MSINEEIWSILDDGRLVELRPYLRTDPVIRSMYLEKDLHEEIFRDRESQREIERFAQLQADLEVFLTIRTIDPGYLYKLTPTNKGVWEIRSTRPNPQIRVFGLFCGKDKFVATHYMDRDVLGDYGSFEWKEAIRQSIAIWNRLFPAYSPLKSDNIDKLIRGALNGKYFK